MRKVISLFMLLLILASCSNGKKNKNALLKESILAVTGLNSGGSSSSYDNLANIILNIEVVSINTSSGSLTLNFYSSYANIKNYEVSKDKGSWESIENKSVYTSSGLVVDKTYNFEIRAKRNGKYSRIFNKTVLFKNGFVWSNLSSSWKKAIAENVSSITGNETSLTDAQESAFFNLTGFKYSGSAKSYNDRLKILSPVKYMKNLKNLDLPHNQITSIPSGAFTSLSSLNRLDLNGNQITSIPANTFTHMDSLYKLQLSGQKNSVYTWTPTQRTDIQAQVKAVPNNLPSWETSSSIYFDWNTSVQGTR